VSFCSAGADDGLACGGASALAAWQINQVLMKVTLLYDLCVDIAWRAQEKATHRQHSMCGGEASEGPRAWCLCVRARASSTVGLLYGGSGAGRSFKWPSITHLRACSHQKPLHPN